jgi:molecular chaperone DnaK
MAVVGIDLGTTNTVVGVARAGQVTAIRDADGEYLIPSVVSFHPSGSVLVGRVAKERRVVDAANTIYSIKRLIGRSWNSVEVARARTRFPFEMREGPGQAALVVARGETFTLPEISAFVLRHAKAAAEKAIGEPVDRAVITVPANFNDLQRAATKVAGRVAGLEVLRILNEPTAAALAYGYGKDKGERIAIYDFGGGTFDVTLLDLSGNVFEVLATAGNTFLGGDDIDLAIAERMAEACLAQHQTDAHADPQVFERLRYYAEKLKVELSTAMEATIDVPDVGFGAKGKPLRLSFGMTRAELEELADPIVRRTFEVCQEALGIARLGPTNFDQVVLVGGSTRLPIVRAGVAKYFGQAPLDRINPDEVVAIGAAIQANALTGHERRRSVIPQPPMPAARSSDGSVAEGLPRSKSQAPPPGTRKMDPHPGGPRGAEGAEAQGARRRVITGMGLGFGQAPRSSRPPPLPDRKGVPPRKGGTLGGVGSPVAGGVPPAAPEPGVAPGQPSDEEPTRVGAAPELVEEARAAVARHAAASQPAQGRLVDDLDEMTSAEAEFDAERGSALPPAPGGLGGTLKGFGSATAAASVAARPAAPAVAVPVEEPPEPRMFPVSSDADQRPPIKAGTGRSKPGGVGAGGFARTMLGGAQPVAAPPRAPPAPPPEPPREHAVPASEPLASFESAPQAAHRLPVSEPRGERVPLPLLVDVTPLSLCVETVGGYRDVVIPRNTPVPCETSRTFVTGASGQVTVLVRVGQGESERFGEATLLGELELSGLRPAPRGEVQIIVMFSLDTDGMLDVRATDAETGHATTARLRLVGLPDAEEVRRMTARHIGHTGS